MQRGHANIGIAPDLLPESFDGQPRWASVEQAHQQYPMQRRKLAGAIVEQAGEISQNGNMPADRGNNRGGLQQMPRQCRRSSGSAKDSLMRRNEIAQQCFRQLGSPGL